MPLFTLILEFGGGTYVTQIRSPSVLAAISECALTLPSDYDSIDLRDRDSLAVQLSEQTPISLSGVHNVWCCSAAVGSQIAVLNIIENTKN